jgi:hypothetical protein
MKNRTQRRDVMGTWGARHWGNDAAADWFDEFFKKTNADRHVKQTLRLDPTDDADEIRAAVFVLLSLGRVYIWPLESLEECLQLASDRMSRILESMDHDSDLATTREAIMSVRDDLETIETRLRELQQEERRD